MRTEVVFTFVDTRNAIGGEHALLAAGVPVRIMSRPSALGEGCGICLRVDEAERERAAAVMRGASVEIEAVYLKLRKNGKVAYILL